MSSSPLPFRKTAPPARADGAAALAAWHLGWAAAAALLALGGRWLAGEGGDATGGAFGGLAGAGLLLMAAPGLMGALLLWRDGPGPRDALLAAWSLAAVGAAALSGGLGGPLAGLMAMPLVAGLALGGLRTAQAGALASAIAALVGLVAAGLMGSAPGAAPGAAALAGLGGAMTAVAAVLALRLGWRAHETTRAAAEGTAGRIQGLLTAQPALTLVTDRAGRPLSAYGAPPSSLSPDALFESGLIAAVHAPDRPAVLAALDQALAGHTGQALFAPRGALDRRLTLLARRLPEGEGAEPRVEPRFAVQLFDATGQYVRELRLETARAEAEAASVGKTRFLANMSHELRTPLNAILGFADIMRQRLFGPLPDRYADYADSIHQAGGHLLDLINDLLDLSKIEAERYLLALERLDAREPVSAAMALVGAQAADKGVALAGLLPPEPLAVDADRRALKQIALNLLSNAVKFTPAGGSVTVTLAVIGPYLELVVADTGVGIAPEDIQRLGRPFEQAGGAEQRAQGTGLGLSLVRALAELHGGRMSVDSTLGEGAAFTVRLPVAALAPAALVAGEAAEAASPTLH